MLKYYGKCDEAILLYQKAFGCSVKSLIHYEDAVNNGWEQPDEARNKQVYHSEIMFGEQEVRMHDDSEEASAICQKQYYAAQFDTEEELVKAFTVLSSEGGEVLEPLFHPPYMVAGAKVKDKFGIKWDMFCDFS